MISGTEDPTEIELLCTYDGGDISKKIIYGNIYNNIAWRTGPKLSLNCIDDTGRINPKPDNKFNVTLNSMSLEGPPLIFKSYIPVSPSDNDMSQDERSLHYRANDLRFTNPSLYKIQKKPVNFSDNALISDMVKKILKENYGYENIDVEETKVKQTIRFANMFPEQAIDSIGHRLVSSKNDTSLYALFLAHENGTEKAIFKTYEGLLKQSPVATLEQRTTNVGLSLEAKRSIIIRIITDRTSLAFLKPNPKSVVYNPVVGRTQEVRDPNQSPGYHPYNVLYSDNESETKVYRNINPHNDYEKNHVAQTIPKQTDYFNRLMQTLTTLEVPYNPRIQVGSTIELKRSRKVADVSGGEDPNINGKVLVTECNINIKPLGQSPRCTMILKVITPSHKE